jgi:zinc transport system ATP-binding protein
LDEPAAGVDFQDQEKFYHLLARLNRERGVTILLVSHDLSVVSKHAHQVLCLANGKIQCQGPPSEIPSMLSQTFGTDMGIFTHAHHH